MRLTLTACLTLAVLVAPVGAMEPAPPPAAPSVSLTKALAFEATSSALETGLFLSFFGGGMAVAGPIMALNFSTSLGVYLANDYAWSAAPPAAPEDENARVLQKAATFRAAALARSFAIGSWLGGAKAAAPLLYAATFNTADTLLYVAVEKLHGGAEAAEAAPAAP